MLLKILTTIAEQMALYLPLIPPNKYIICYNYCTFQEDVAKAGGKERTLYRNMRKLESETRKQEQICNSKKALVESANTAARKHAQDQLRAVDSHQLEVSIY